MHVLLLETIAFVGATVHTFQPAPEGAAAAFAEPSVATVLVEDGKITAVGPDVEVPEDAREVDLSGLHLVPGLIDALTSFDAVHDPLYLSAGVTLVRDGGSPTGQMLLEKSRSMRERHPGPTLHATSALFASQLSTNPAAFVLGPPDTAEEQVNEFMSLVLNSNSRIESVVFDDSLTIEQHGLVCAAAETYGVDAWGPLPVVLPLKVARAQGQRTLVGLDSLLPQGERFETLPDDFDFGPIVEGLRSGEWRVVPLLLGTGRILRGAATRVEPPAAAALSPEVRTSWRVDLETFRILSGSPGLDLARRSLERQRGLVRQLHAAGVQLVPGTGSPSGFIMPGSGLVDELEEWVRAGVSPAEALALATARASDALGHPEESGRIAPGLSANMIALTADPRESIEALRAPAVVVLRGEVRTRDLLDGAVEDLIARQEAAAAARVSRLELEAPPMPEGELVVDGQANLSAYGYRTAVERYQAVRMAEDVVAYGARIRILPTADLPEKELVLLQVMKGGLVQRFLLTLDELGPDGEPVRENTEFPAFSARGSLVAETGALGVERLRDGLPVATVRTEEPIAFIEGSSILSGLIAARHCPEGFSYVLQFDPAFMEPVVDRALMAVSVEDGRFTLQDSRGIRVFGFGEGGAFLFGARAENGGRLDFEPAAPETPEQAEAVVSTMRLDPARVFRGDPERWNKASSTEASAGTGAKGGEGDR
ncbi:MAG: amidohydrolase family protein [Planctomycetota bacterium]|nr:amidohydrolase family protein [Planctomycetota bacterium]